MKVTTRRSVIFQEDWTLVRSGVTSHIEDTIERVGRAPELVVFENTLHDFLGGLSRASNPGQRRRTVRNPGRRQIGQQLLTNVFDFLHRPAPYL